MTLIPTLTETLSRARADLRIGVGWPRLHLGLCLCQQRQAGHQQPR